MKKIFRKGIIILMIVAMLAVTACNKSDAKSTFKTGSFDGTVFTNEWSNLRFEFPENLKIATPDEIKALVAQGNAGLYADDEKLENAMNKAAELKLAYDFLVTNEDGSLNIQLTYENLAMSVGGTKLDEKAYLETALKPVFEDASLGYELLGEEKVNIADKEFYKYSMSGFNGAIMQDMYCHKIEDRMIVFAVTYVPTLADQANEIVSKISTVK